jgi:hypothetical protein
MLNCMLETVAFMPANKYNNRDNEPKNYEFAVKTLILGKKYEDLSAMPKNLR